MLVAYLWYIWGNLVELIRSTAISSQKNLDLTNLVPIWLLVSHMFCRK